MNMDWEITIECSESLSELQQKIEKTLAEGYELLDGTNEVHLERPNKTPLLIYGQHFIKWFPTPQE